MSDVYPWGRQKYKGKIDWHIDNSSVIIGQDWYSNTIEDNVIKTANVIINNNGKHTLKAVANGKNALFGSNK